MSTNDKVIEKQEQEPLRENDKYKEVVTLYQRGDWEVGLGKLIPLLEEYPGDVELLRLKDDYEFRVVYDQEVTSRTTESRKRIWTKIGVWVVVGLVVAGAIFFGVKNYANVIQDQYQAAREALLSEVQQVENSVAINNARNYLAAGRYQDALVTLNQIEENDPDYPELDELMAVAQEQATKDEMYQQAIQLVVDGEIEAALAMFNELNEMDAFYKDVNLQITNLERQYLLGDYLNRGDIAFEVGDWASVVEEYENYLALDPLVDTDNVKDRLYQGYISYIQASLSKEEVSLEELELAEEYLRRARSLKPQNREILEDRLEIQQSITDLLVSKYIAIAQNEITENPASIEALTTAENYFGKALVLNPNSAAIYVSYNMARDYLEGFRNFNKALWDETIIALEEVYQQDRTYADGTASQLLYDAYIARGNFWLAVGGFENALADFQQASLVAQDNPEHTLMNFESGVLVAFALGRLGNYRDAALLYRSVIYNADIKFYAEERDTLLLFAFNSAETNLEIGKYKTAYYFYADAFERTNDIFKITSFTIGEGDYLALIAKENQTTTNLILEYNQFSDPSKVYVGQEIMIPTLE
jgi:tetratricopeptide (TPR) repeat protein